MLRVSSQLLQGNVVVQAPLQVAGKEWLVTCVSMGNPHAVVFGTQDSGVKVNIHACPSVILEGGSLTEHMALAVHSMFWL